MSKTVKRTKFIGLRLDTKTHSALKGFARTHNTSVQGVLMWCLKEQLGVEEPYIKSTRRR